MIRRLSLHRETLSELTPAELAGIAGAGESDTCQTATCEPCPGGSGGITCAPLITILEVVTTTIP